MPASTLARPRPAAPPAGRRPPAASVAALAAPATTTADDEAAALPVTIALRCVEAGPPQSLVAFSTADRSFRAAPRGGGAVAWGQGGGGLAKADDGDARPPPPPARTASPGAALGPRARGVQASPAPPAHAAAQATPDVVVAVGVQAGPGEAVARAAAAAPPLLPFAGVAAAARALARAAAAAANRSIAADAVSWDDPSDATRPGAASFLPLWSLPPPRAARRAPASAAAWCPHPPSLALAVAYGHRTPGGGGRGAVAVWAPAVDAGDPAWSAETAAPATAVAFDPSAPHRLAVGFGDGSVAVYEVEVEGGGGGGGGATTPPALAGGAGGRGHAGPVSALAWLPGAAAPTLASTGADGHLLLWARAPGGGLAATPAALLPADAAADADPGTDPPPGTLVGGTTLDAAPSPNEGALLVGDDGGGARVVAPAAGAAPAAAFAPRARGAPPLVAAAWSPTTRGAFLTVAADGAVGVWQATRAQVRVWEGMLKSGKQKDSKQELRFLCPCTNTLPPPSPSPLSRPPFWRCPRPPWAQHGSLRIQPPPSLPLPTEPWPASSSRAPPTAPWPASACSRKGWRPRAWE